MTAPDDLAWLPVLPPLKSAHSCRRCRRWLEGEWAATDPAGRVQIERQMGAGRCDDCTLEEARQIIADAGQDLGAGAVRPQPGLRFAACPTCRREMSGTRCAVAVRVIDGRTLVRRPYVKLFAFAADHCNDCNTPVGSVHHRDCDQDRCPVPDCVSQAACCEHQALGWPTVGGRRAVRRRPAPH